MSSIGRLLSRHRGWKRLMRDIIMLRFENRISAMADRMFQNLLTLKENEALSLSGQIQWATN